MTLELRPDLPAGADAGAAIAADDATSGDSPPEPQAPRETLLLQISDPHFGTERPTVLRALETLCRESAPELVLLTGDITQRARATEFAAARAFMDRLAPRAALVIPGNHDIPLYDLRSRLLSPYGHYARAFGPAGDADYESDTLLVLALNTTRWWRHKNGELSDAQIERSAERLARARPGQCRVVAVHQPVAVTRESDRTNLLRGHERAVRRWAEAGADLVVGGHIHLPFVVPLRERWPDLPRPMWAVQAGTALSTRVRGGVPNSVNLIRLGAERRVERWDYAADREAFVRIGLTLLR